MYPRAPTNLFHRGSRLGQSGPQLTLDENDIVIVYRAVRVDIVSEIPGRDAVALLNVCLSHISRLDHPIGMWYRP